MKFASWNINSINLRKDAVLKWMSDENIDVLGLQEIKCETEKFPQDFFKENDYYIEILGQKGFGYDPIFIPQSNSITFGQMPKMKKINMDHRYIAFKKLKKQIKTL